MSAEGENPCTQVGCAGTDALPCEYVDRRGRECRTAWCSAHRVTVEDHVYCRRHAGIMSSLPTLDSSLVSPLPDLDNRAPSLVGWVSRQIDADVWRLMLKELDASTGANLIADPVSLVFVGITRQRAWERAWKVDSHTGTAARVSILVEESDDTMVTVKVGQNAVDRLVPPWITHRLQGERVSPDDDVREREEFHQRVIDAVERGLARERELTSYTSEGRTGSSPGGQA